MPDTLSLNVSLDIPRTNSNASSKKNNDFRETVLNDYELTDKQYAAWKQIKNNWIVSDYEAIQAENKVKLTCKSCE